MFTHLEGNQVAQDWSGKETFTAYNFLPLEF